MRGCSLSLWWPPDPHLPPCFSYQSRALMLTDTGISLNEAFSAPARTCRALAFKFLGFKSFIFLEETCISLNMITLPLPCCVLSALFLPWTHFSPAQSFLAGGFGPWGQLQFPFCSSHSHLRQVDKWPFSSQSFHTHPVNYWQWWSGWQSGLKQQFCLI